MATHPKDVPYHYYTLEEYFGLEESSDARFEYWDGDIYCMSGGSRAHGDISGNVFYRLRQRLEGGPCRAFTSDTAIWTPTLPPYRYPDASVACGEPQFRHVNVLDALVNPVVIVEVLSPSTKTLDQGKKFEAYRAIQTVREYLLVAQDEPRVTHCARQSEDVWTQRDVTGIGDSVELEPVGCSLALRDIYEGVEFPA